MKKVIFLFAIAGLSLLVTGCDQDSIKTKNFADDKPTIAAMIAGGKEEKTEHCSIGNVSLNCEFLTGDQAGSGKWHHAKIFIHKNGSVSMSMDGQSYYQRNAEVHSFGGDDVATYTMKGTTSGSAQIRIRSSNDGNTLSFDAYNSDNKRIALGSIRTN